MIGMLPMMFAVQAWQDTAFAYGRMYLSAQEVIHRRTMQMAFGRMGPEEAARMVFEKPAALAASLERSAGFECGSVINASGQMALPPVIGHAARGASLTNPS